MYCHLVIHVFNIIKCSLTFEKYTLCPLSVLLRFFMMLQQMELTFLQTLFDIYFTLIYQQNWTYIYFAKKNALNKVNMSAILLVHKCLINKDCTVRIMKNPWIWLHKNLNSKSRCTNPGLPVDKTIHHHVHVGDLQDRVSHFLWRTVLPDRPQPWTLRVGRIYNLRGSGGWWWNNCGLI